MFFQNYGKKCVMRNKTSFKINFFLKFNFSKNKNHRNDQNQDQPFPKFERSDFYDEQDLIINIGPKEAFKGMLMICPTPIGNINDISIRQFEALKNGDILACEDTRKTGKLLELISLKKMKSKFYSEFGVSFEEFLNRGGMDMNDEKLKKEFFSENSNANSWTTDNKNDKQDFEEFSTFYDSQEDREKLKEFQKKLKKTEEWDEKRDKSKKFEERIYSPRKEEMIINKEIVNNERILSEIKLNFSEAETREKFVKKGLDSHPFKKELNDEFYSAVESPEEFFKRRDILDQPDFMEKLSKKVEKQAESFDEDLQLSYKLRSKARFIMGMQKKHKFHSKEEEEKSNTEKTNEEKEEELDEEMNKLSDNNDENLLSNLKKRIKEEKETKGRGILIPFNNQNEEKKTQKLIKAMKLGLRVVLVSDAGTPTISDPGYKLVREASKNGIIVEPIPGASAILTALSASALPTDKFMFVGYLSKSPIEKFKKIEEIRDKEITAIFFESPNRLKRTLETFGEIFGLKHEIYIGVELTKKFERHYRGNIAEVIEQINVNEEIKGEITIITAPKINILTAKDDFYKNDELNDKVEIESINFAKKVRDIIGDRITEVVLHKLIQDVCNISKVKSIKIINTLKNRESSTQKIMRLTRNKIDVKIKKPEDYMMEEKPEHLDEKKTKKVMEQIIKQDMQGKFGKKNS
jgi:16S rRNA (cytidine(1402)-2'-O)-methyltransferase